MHGGECYKTLIIIGYCLVLSFLEKAPIRVADGDAQKEEKDGKERLLQWCSTIWHRNYNHALYSVLTTQCKVHHWFSFHVTVACSTETVYTVTV